MNYIDFINTEDERFKLCLLWWYTLPNNISDYEFSFRFLQKNTPINEIKNIIQERFNEKPENFVFEQLQKLIKKHLSVNSSIENISNMLFELVFKGIYNSRNDSFYLFHCWNRAIRNFRDAKIVNTDNINCMEYVKNFRKTKFGHFTIF